MVNWLAVTLTITIIYILPKKKVYEKVVRLYKNKTRRLKTAIVVLDDIGMNFEKAIRHARCKNKLIIASQFVKKAELAKIEIAEATQNKNIKIMFLNRTDENSVVEFAQMVMENEATIDVLINNEGFDLSDLQINFKQQQLANERFLNHCIDFMFEDEIDSITKYKLPGWYHASYNNKNNNKALTW